MKSLSLDISNTKNRGGIVVLGVYKDGVSSMYYYTLDADEIGLLPDFPGERWTLIEMVNVVELGDEA